MAPHDYLIIFSTFLKKIFEYFLYHENAVNLYNLFIQKISKCYLSNIMSFESFDFLLKFDIIYIHCRYEIMNFKQKLDIKNKLGKYLVKFLQSKACRGKEI
jgi:hypothetical protein